MSERTLTCSAALAEALHEEMSLDESNFIIGEDLTAHAGIFGQFKGIPEKFPERIIDSPISEAGIVGVGLGSALTGMRPIVDLHFSDFVTCCMDELCNQTAKIRYMLGGQAKIPMVVWCPDGAGLRAAAQHSQSLEAKKLIIATGSSLDSTDIPGLNKAAMTTDQVLEMVEAPSSILIWGTAGPIEAEMAVLLSTFGCKVYLSTEDPRLLPKEDHDTSQRIAQSFREQGIEILPRLTLKSVKKSKQGYTCTLSGSKEKTMEVKKVLVSSRKSNTADMGLKEVGVKLNEDGSIMVNEKLETSVEGIYAIGDATGGWMLSHASSSMAVAAAENAMGKTNSFPFHLIPRGIWTYPEVGAVGLSEEEAEKKGFEIEIGDFPYSINGLAMCRNEISGNVKIVSDARYGEILGVHIVGNRATDLVGEAVLAMQLEATTRELANSIRVHPTFSETVVDSARDAENWALYLPKR